MEMDHQLTESKVEKSVGLYWAGNKPMNGGEIAFKVPSPAGCRQVSNNRTEPGPGISGGRNSPEGASRFHHHSPTRGGGWSSGNSQRTRKPLPDQSRRPPSAARPQPKPPVPRDKNIDVALYTVVITITFNSRYRVHYIC